MGLFLTSNRIAFQHYYEKLLFKLTNVSLFLGLLYPVVNNGSFITNLISLVSTFSAIAAIFIFFYKRKNQPLTGLLIFFIIVVLYMLVLGFSTGNLWSNKTILMTAITQDLRYVTLFLLGGIYSTSERFMSYYHYLMKNIAMISIIMGVFAILLIVRNGSLIVRGEENNGPSYHLWWASATCFAYCGIFAFLSDKKSRKTWVYVFVIYFVIGMLFLKRSCFLNCIIIILLSLYLSSKNTKGSKTILRVFGLLIAAFFILLFIPSVKEIVFGALFDRFRDSASNIEEFDRIIEWQAFLEQTSQIQLYTGYGIGNYPIYDRYQMGHDDNILNALHLGYSNIIFKGGALYAAFYIVLYITIFIKWFKCKSYSIRYLVCFGVSVSSLISLFYEGSWTYTIIPFCISAPMFYAASYKRTI